MMKITLVMMLSNAWSFTFSSHPLFLSFVVIIQSMLTSMMVRTITSSSWLPMTMFLVMVGGLMIIFLYLTSISSNKMMNKTGYKKIMFMLIIWFPISSSMIELSTNDNTSLLDNFNKEFLKMYTTINYQSSIFMFLYLLFSLIIFVNMMNLMKGPMRKKY